MARTLTSANAVILITVPGLFPVPQQLQGFATDDVYDVDSITPTETAMGVDGVLSAGWTPMPVKQGFTLQADSTSNDFFEAWYEAQQAARDVYFCTGETYLSSVERFYYGTRGVLTDYAPMAGGKKILQPRKFSITWGRVSPAAASF